LGELLGFSVEQLLDPRQRYAGVGEGLDELSRAGSASNPRWW
jgi:hypothetical protein